MAHGENECVNTLVKGVVGDLLNESLGLDSSFVVGSE